jgi:hypothetical protein
MQTSGPESFLFIMVWQVDVDKQPLGTSDMRKRRSRIPEGGSDPHKRVRQLDRIQSGAICAGVATRSQRISWGRTIDFFCQCCHPTQTVGGSILSEGHGMEGEWFPAPSINNAPEQRLYIP